MKNIKFLLKMAVVGLSIMIGIFNPVNLMGESKYEKSVSKYDISRSYINYRIEGSKCYQLTEKERDAIMGDIRSSNFKIIDTSTHWEHSYVLQDFNRKEFTVFEDYEECQIEARRRTRGQR